MLSAKCAKFCLRLRQHINSKLMQLSTLEIFSSGNANRLEATLEESEHKMRQLEMRNYYVPRQNTTTSLLRSRRVDSA